MSQTKDMERTVTLRDGSAALIRPIRSEDSGALLKALKKLTAKDIRSRFFSFVKDLKPVVLDGWKKLGAESALALVATNANDPEEIWAGGRLFFEPDGQRAEYAAMVRSDRQGVGLGHAMMDTLIECGRQREIVEIWGMVMSENRGMLELASRLGFEIRRDDDDASVKIVRKYL
jgi:acetyltransferase